MPKDKSLKTHLIDLWIQKQPNPAIFTRNGNILFCQPCSKRIPCEKKFQIDQHVATKSHQESCKRPTKRQTFVDNTVPSTTRTFRKDLCEALICANIPIYKLENNTFKVFLEKYTSEQIPSTTTIRSDVNTLYEKVLDKIRLELIDKFIWLSVDESTNVRGEYVANLIVGALNEDGYSKPYLLQSKVLQKTNFSTISIFVNQGIQLLYRHNTVPIHKILLLVTDGVAYMVKAGQSLKVFYPNLVHVTCLCHALNLVAENIRLQYPHLNSLISNGKKVFLKAPLRIQIFREKYPNLSLPPEPVLTRWGTWLNAVKYYAESYQQFKDVVSEFVSESAAISECHNLFRNKDVERDLLYIRSNFVFIADVIKLLESQGMLLTDTIKHIEETMNRLKTVPGLTATKVTDKFTLLLKKNPGYTIMKSISALLSGESVDLADFTADQKKHIHFFKFSPMTSCDVERSFSMYKNLLTDRRHSLSNENIEKYLICSCNA